MNIFAQLFKSLYSPNDIARFRFQGIGKTILYVFFLTFISVLPMTYHFINDFVEGIKNTGELLKSELPEFTIENGELSSSADKPVIIDKSGFRIVFDSTGQTTKEDVERYTNAIGFLKHEIVLVANSETQYYDYAMFQNMKLTDKDVHSFIETLQSLMPVIIPVTFVILYIFASASKFIGITFLAFIGLIIRGTLGKNIKYRHTWIMSAYAVTLSTIFFTIMESLQVVVPYALAIHWFVSVTVLFLAIKEIPSPKLAE
ncbi:MAG TPA: DUF1189 domain-containing protein [Anoxybacillus sp.]|jgi:hypothetical protein|nr:DUF1189 domain-containing protein [Anoxybacillus sp.]